MNNTMIKGKKILITGGTGSFGSTMSKFLLDLNPQEIVIFSRDELKQFEMRNAYNDEKLTFVIGDTRDYNSIYKALNGVDYVFHAAALKQVPTVEFFPMEGVKTNILGSNNVLNASISQNVKKVVVLSTDKAVYPINAMGMSKALMEKVMISLAREVHAEEWKTKLCGVRYGNVMYSRGSVIPFFVDLIKQNKDLTITDPSMTRFLLPLADSVELVLFALTKGENGSIYVKKAPAATVLTIAQALCELFQYDESKMKIVGIRAGEKMHETLISREEWQRVQNEGNFYSIPVETQELDYDKYYSVGKKTKNDKEGYTSDNTKQLSVNQTKKLLLSLPEIQDELKKLDLLPIKKNNGKVIKLN